MATLQEILGWYFFAAWAASAIWIPLRWNVLTEDAPSDNDVFAHIVAGVLTWVFMSWLILPVIPYFEIDRLRQP